MNCFVVPSLRAFRLLAFAAGLFLAPALLSAAVRDFSFVQASDVHAPMAQSRQTIQRMKSIGTISMTPFALTAPKPAFAIITGDLNEFGGGSGWWAEYLSYWKGCAFPTYNVLGNHDNTWRSNLKSLREVGSPPCYSFTANGCLFVGLMTPTVQDPRPSIGEEEIVWLRKALASAGRSTPVFAFFHHPLGGSEFSSRYDYDRLLDILREHNTVLLMAGHSHGHVYRPVQDLDQVTGGSTFGPTAGFAVYSIKSGMLRAAYCKADAPAAEIKLLEKKIPEQAPFPEVEITMPAARSICAETLKIEARLEGRGAIEAAAFSIDDELKGSLELTPSTKAWVASGEAKLSGLMAGAHYLRIEFKSGDKTHARSTDFVYQPASKPMSWRVYLGASAKSTPTPAGGMVYAAANDGRLRAIEAASGKIKWEAPTGAEILTQPLLLDDKVYVGNGLGQLLAFSVSGKKLWTFTAADAVYSSPVACDGKIVFGCNDGTLHALDAQSGKETWVNRDAEYSIEAPPCVSEGRIFYGAWDQYVRCVDATNGKLLWKQVCEGSRKAKGAKRYFSAADAAPVVCQGKLMIADRAYMLGIYKADTGELVGSVEKVAATGLSEDGQFVYLRHTDGKLTKIDSSGKPIWSVPAHLGAIPTAPVEKGGSVYVASAIGLVSAIAADSGKILWQYQASPKLFVMSSVTADGSQAYVTAFDGSVTALRCSGKE